MSALRSLSQRRVLRGRVLAPPVDVWLAGALSVICVLGVLALPDRAAYRSGDALAVALAAASGMSLLWRQRAPLWAMAGTGAVVAANAAAGYVIGFVQWPPWIALFTCFALGARRTRVAALAIVAVSVGGYLAFNRGGIAASEVSGIAVTILVSTIAGDALRSRRQRDAAEEARRLDETRREAMRAENMLLQERSRLARELHDSLGHTVNVMVLQAGVGRRVFSDNPDYSREALECIESVGRGALNELDQVLRVLQPDERRSPSAPTTPTVADLEELVGRVRGTGRDVELRVELELDLDLMPSAARALYRIIQEALTNAVKHTSAGSITVSIAKSGDCVEADVFNEAPELSAPVPGRGLVNMRERARLEGGTVEAGLVDGGFHVRASLPVRARLRA